MAIGFFWSRKKGLLLLFLLSRHGPPNEEIHGGQYIQMTPLTFVGESQWCLWHPGSWHYGWYVTLHNTERQRKKKKREQEIRCTQKQPQK